MQSLNKEMVEKARIRLQAEQDLKLKAEKERLLHKVLGENHMIELQMQKDQAQRQSEANFREKKRGLEKKQREELDRLRDKFDEEDAQQRVDIKKRIQQKFERKEKHNEQDIQEIKTEFKELAAEIAKDKRDALDEEKRRIEK